MPSIICCTTSNIRSLWMGQKKNCRKSNQLFLNYAVNVCKIKSKSHKQSDVNSQQLVCLFLTFCRDYDLFFEKFKYLLPHCSIYFVTGPLGNVYFLCRGWYQDKLAGYFSFSCLLKRYVKNNVLLLKGWVTTFCYYLMNAYKKLLSIIVIKPSISVIWTDAGIWVRIFTIFLTF